MKNLKLAMIYLGISLIAMVATEAEAGRIKEPPEDSRTEMPEEMTKPRRYDKLPTMRFMSGVLSLSTHSGWQIGETPLYLHEGCAINVDGDVEGSLQEGRKAVVMGAMVGEAISAWSIYIPKPDYQATGFKQSNQLKEPGPNPDVGRILKSAN
jgi:hypothetical protein